MIEGMQFSEEQIQNILEIKEKISKELEKRQEEMELLTNNMKILDLILKQSSFTKASELGKISEPKPADSYSIPITRGNGGQIIANAFVTEDQVSIILQDEIDLSPETPPFKSFFLDRIIGEMKKKDHSDAETGKIQSESIINYVINKNGPNIREILIKNYRQRERVNEIINTAAWSFSRMLENTNK